MYSTLSYVIMEGLSDSVFNLLWGILFCIVGFVLVLIAYHFFGKLGVFTWIGIASIIANIMVTKNIEYFTLYATLGNVFYGSIFLATDILTEHYGKQEAKRSVLIGFFADLVLIVSMQMALVFRPYANDDFAATTQTALEQIFGLTPRICLGSLIAYLVSQFLDIVIFSKIKSKTHSKYMWLRNNTATMISQIFDTLIFVSISFAGVEGYSIDVLWNIFITTYLLKFVVAILDTPFLYISKHIKSGILVGENPNFYLDYFKRKFKKGEEKEEELDD